MSTILRIPDEDSRSEDSESAGSLCDFIVDDDGYDGGSSDAEEGEDNGVDEEEEDDAEVRRQYNPSMESRGIVVGTDGVVRSTRSTRGKRPVQYVDDSYAEMMLDDVGSDIEHMSSCDSEETYDDPDDDDFVA